MAIFEVTDTQTGITLELEGDSPPTEIELEQIFAALPAPTPQDFIAQRQQELAESVGPLEATAIAAGRGLTTIGRGLGFVEQEEPEVTQAFERLEQERPIATTVGEIAGESAPFILPGGAIAKTGSLAGRAALSGGLGVAEAATIARGKGANPLQTLASAVGGGSIAAGLELIAPRLGRIARRFAERRRARLPSGNLVDSQGNPTPEFQQVLDETGLNFEDIVAETRREFEAAGAPTQQQIAEELATPTTPGQTVSTEFGVEQAGLAQGRTPTQFATPELSSVAATNDALQEVSRLVVGADSTKVGQQARQLVEDLNMDQAVLDSAERLNIEIPLSSAARDRTFQEAAQAAKSQRGSELARREARAIDQTRESVREFISDLRGGDLSVASFDDKLSRRFFDEIGSLRENSDRAFKIVEQAIPRAVDIDIPSSRRFIRQTLEEVGDNIDALSAPERDLLNLVRRAQQGNPITYGAVDRIRRDIGRGFERQGIYQDVEDKILADVYNAISTDQIRVADGVDRRVGDALREGNRLISTRKDLEKVSKNLFGNQLEKSILPQIQTAANELAKGNRRPLQKILRNVPAEFRPEASAVVLDRVFATASKGADLSEGFVKAFAQLNKNPEAKRELFKNLPGQAIKTFNDIGNVWTGLIRSKALENKSKTARDLLQAMPAGGIEKMLLGAEAASKVPGVSNVMGTVVSAVKGRSKTAIEKADDFITSRAFEQAIKEAAVARTEDQLLRINQKLRENTKFKNWFKTLPRDDQRAIESQGFISWFTQPAATVGAVEPDTEQVANDGTNS